jgi:predicted MPP superfamily phosphohydrolase
MRAEFVLAISVLLGLLLFLFQQLRQFGTASWETIPRWQKAVRVSAAIIPLALFSVVCWGFFIEPNRLVLHQETIQIENWPIQLKGLRIALIGDLHTDDRFINEQKLRKIVELTNAQHPDLIVLLGDYIQGGRKETSHLVAPEITAADMKDLKAPLGVYAILGNHDWWFNGERVRRAFEGEGIPILEDEAKELNWNGKSFWLAGLADLWTRPQHVSETIAKAPNGSTVIALTHNPDIFPNLPQSVPLLLAAHTHGGQVNLPLIGTPVVPSDYGSKYTAGHVLENGHHLFVTTGIGTSILPVRFRVPPEIVLLTIE